MGKQYAWQSGTKLLKERPPEIGKRDRTKNNKSRDERQGKGSGSEENCHKSSAQRAIAEHFSL